MSTGVHEFGLRLLGDRGLAEELVQESYMRLWRTADRFDLCRGNLAAYLFTLTRSGAGDLWRRLGVRAADRVRQPNKITHRRAAGLHLQPAEPGSERPDRIDPVLSLDGATGVQRADLPRPTSPPPSCP
jgi:DNA-directed RNA polymerase specialized sigma24 family protein